MSWPMSQDYNEAVQDPASSFADADLRRGEPALNAMGLPRPRSGNFADVYELSCPAGGTKWAVKCFTRQVPGLRERYAAVSQHLQQARLPFTVDFQYLEQGIRVLGQWYPVLKMSWVEGLLLNAFVRDNLDNPTLLQALGQTWLRMAKRLREARVAHGDLQHGNVILVPGGKTASLAVKLIDYDGMWVPALAARHSGEVGHPNFQHPRRLRDGTYNAEVDRFPILVVAASLRALALGGRDLWERYDNGDNLLFKESDLRAPAESALFQELRGMGDPQLQGLITKVEAAAGQALEATPLVEEGAPEESKPAPRVQAAAESGPEWNFADGGQPSRQRKAKRGAVPVWAWAAAAAVLVAALGGGAFFAARQLGGDPRRQVAHGAPPRGTPTTAPSPTRGRAEKLPADPGPRRPPDGLRPPAAVLPDTNPSTPAAFKPLPVTAAPLPLPGSSPDTRQPVPDGEALAAGKKEMEQNLKEGLSPWQRKVLANNLGMGPPANLSPAARYAALREARDRWAGDGDVFSSLRVASEIARLYRVNRREVWAETIALVAQSAPNPDQNEYAGEVALQLAGEARAADEYDLATRLAATARAAAGKARKAALGVAAERLSQELTAAKPDLPAYKAALAVLAQDSDNPEANGKVGRFRCIHQDAWDEGLPLVARGGDQVLQALAVKDLAGPSEAAACRELGDGWWAAAAKEGDKSAARQAYLRRAHLWYQAAPADLPGVKERMTSIARLVPDAPDRWAHVEVPDGVAKGGPIRLPAGKSLVTRRFYRGEVDVTVVARAEKKGVCLSAGCGGLVIWNGDEGGGGLSVHRPDSTFFVDYRRLFGGSRAASEPANLDPNKRCMLRWQLTPDGMKVWVDDELIYENNEPYDLSTPRPVGLSAGQNPIEVHSLAVKPIPRPAPGRKPPAKAAGGDGRPSVISSNDDLRSRHS